MSRRTGATGFAAVLAKDPDCAGLEQSYGTEAGLSLWRVLTCRIPTSSAVQVHPARVPTAFREGPHRWLMWFVLAGGQAPTWHSGRVLRCAATMILFFRPTTSKTFPALAKTARLRSPLRQVMACPLPPADLPSARSCCLKLKHRMERQNYEMDS